MTVFPEKNFRWEVFQQIQNISCPRTDMTMMINVIVVVKNDQNSLSGISRNKKFKKRVCK
jgi:hypothetical protein